MKRKDTNDHQNDDYDHKCCFVPLDVLSYSIWDADDYSHYYDYEYYHGCCSSSSSSSYVQISHKNHQRMHHTPHLSNEDHLLFFFFAFFFLFVPLMYLEYLMVQVAQQMH